MPTPELTLPKSFVRFLLAGLMVFTLVYWIASSCLLSDPDAHRDRLALHLLLRSFTHESLGRWIAEARSAYLPFFLSQRGIVVPYLIAAPLAWSAAHWYDTKILRRENTL